MRRMQIAPWSLLAGVTFFAYASLGLTFEVEVPRQELEGCKRCDMRGVKDCKQHSMEMLEYEAQVLFCSVAARCEDCLGAFLVDCDRCEGGPDSHLIAERQKRAAEFLAKDKMSEYLERPLPWVETEHFHLVVDTGKLPEGKKKRDGHEIMHRVANDVERVAELIHGHYDLKGKERPAVTLAGSEEHEFPHEYRAKMRMWIWGNAEDHSAVMNEFLYSGASGDFKMLGKDPVFSVWTEQQFSTVPAVRTLFAHNASHMLLSNLYKELWVGDLGGGWFDAGAGHWYEYAIFGASIQYCIEEATAEQDYHGGLWRAALKKRFKKEDSYFLPRLLPMNTGAMTLPDQAVCFSFYDWLVAQHPKQLPVILQGLKREEPPRDLLKRVFGKGLFSIEDDWRGWVQDTYPNKEKRRR